MRNKIAEEMLISGKLTLRLPISFGKQAGILLTEDFTAAQGGVAAQLGNAVNRLAGIF